MLPPTFSCEVRSILTPRSWNSRASVRCTIVAPTCDLMSSPTIGTPAFLKRLFQDFVHVPLGCLLGAGRKVGDDHVGARLLEDLDDVRGRTGRLGDLLLQI